MIHHLPIIYYPSHGAGVLQPVVAASVRQGEADVLAPLPAAADLPEPQRHAGQDESQAAQQSPEREDQHQQEGGGQVEPVLVPAEGSVPAEEECVEGGHEQGTVT